MNATVQVDGARGSAAAVPVALQRARGHAEVGFAVVDGRTGLKRLFQDGQAKIRLPRVHGGAPPVAVLINTAGGITGGDRLVYGATWGAGTRAVVTSQAAERIYRSSGDAGRIETRLTVGAGAEASWLPQETILFDRARLERRLDIDMAPDATLLAVETVVFGRTAMGEAVRNGAITDHWRLRRGGRLAFADTLRLDGDAATILSGPATGGGAVATATVLLAAPDAEARLEAVRAILEEGASESGASAFDGLLVIRLIAGAADALRRDLVRLLEMLGGRPLPRVWSC